MLATCPTDKSHATFDTVAHVMQAWKVDREGNFLEVIDESLEVSHKPTPGNIWTCTTCGAQASVED